MPKNQNYSSVVGQNIRKEGFFQPHYEKIGTPRPARSTALASTVKKEKSWWSWDLKASGEKDPAKKEAIYRKGLEQFPDSTELTGNFANFMDDIRKDYDEAEKLFRRALDLDPRNANHTGNFSSFLFEIEQEEAKEKLLKAWEVNKGENNQLAAELLLYWSLLGKLGGNDANQGLAEEKKPERLRVASE